MQIENTCFNYFHTAKLLPMYAGNVSNVLKPAFSEVFIYI